MPADSQQPRFVSSELVKEIKKAFGAVPYPGCQKSLLPVCFDYDTESKEMHAYFENRPWDKCRAQDEVFRDSSSYCFLTPIGLHYYMPAYLIAIVTEHMRIGRLTSTFLHSLIPPTNSSARQEIKWFAQSIEFLTHRGILTSAQRACIKKVFEFARSIKDELEFSERALNRAIEYYGREEK